MKKTKQKRIPYRRKREGLTNYGKRLRLLSSGIPRLIIRKSTSHMLVQIAGHESTGDKIVVTAHTSELKKLGWEYSCSNTPAAYLAGYIAGKRGLEKGVSECIVDLGLQAKGSRLFAAIKGALDAGMKIPVGEDALPADSRIKGEHIPGKEGITQSFIQVKERIK
jgi:large subunit ribosomal protein L18